MVADLAYFTLAVPDTERGARFYEGLFGWQLAPAAAGHSKAYRHIENTTPPGALVNHDDAMTLRPYFKVGDIREAVRKVRALGGRSDEPSESPTGWSCLAHDDQGVPFGLWEPAEGY